VEKAFHPGSTGATFSLRVAGPAFYCRAVELRLRAMPQVALTGTPDVVVLLGGSWLSELDALRGGEAPERAAAIILVASTNADLLLAAQRGIQVFLDEDGSENEFLHGLQAAAGRSGYCSPGLMSALLQALRAPAAGNPDSTARSGT
jgi:DNA-binding NarL/FixJ family response regulator